jgi:glycosyltransferase involved in cell wall biosynthesis
MNKTAHIVWIATWYPHDGEPYAGDFIQRHAQAVAMHTPVTVYACFGHVGPEKTMVTKTGNLTEVISYFNIVGDNKNTFYRKIYWYRWYNILKNRLVKHVAEIGMPTCIHCHIILNAGMLGWWAKRKWKIPYILTEHWVGYMAGIENGFAAFNSYSKFKMRQITANANVVTGVSNALITNIKKLVPAANYVHWPNVVNEQVFNYNAALLSPNNRPTFIHISTLKPQKNVAGILHAFANAVKSIPLLLLKIVGPMQDAYTELVHTLQLQNNVEWLGEMPQQALLPHMRSAKALILFSNYETFGCVVIEANAVGLPVIASDIAPLQELIRTNINGVTVPKGDINALATAIISIANNELVFDAASISEGTIALFNYKKIGQQMVDLYQQNT